ncbi:MAG TPA: hypothetical protein VG370_31225 [Chloroflexota bacterium]|jgi:hypothetical protein|nr:hypothetical protein [Chloroflexota bacterium]
MSAAQTADPTTRAAARIGHELANKLTAQLILVDLLVELADGEVGDLALQLAGEMRGLADLADRLQALQRGKATAQLPD